MQYNKPVDVEMTSNTTRDNREVVVLLVVTGFFLFALLCLSLVLFAGSKLYSNLVEGNQEQLPLPSRQLETEELIADAPMVDEAESIVAPSSPNTHVDDPVASVWKDSHLDSELPSLGPDVPKSLEKTESAIKYAWESDSHLVYEFEIEARLGSRKIDYRGRNTLQKTGKPPMVLATEHQMDAHQKDERTGSGFVIHPQGIVVTCAHVVKGATSVQALIGEATLTATVIKLDLENDLAFLRLSTTGHPFLKLADSDRVRLGQEIRAIGFPLSDVLGESIKVTKGEISGRGGPDGIDGLQLDVTVNPGNSGGPLVDHAGRLVGITSSLLSGAGISEVGFAIPSNKIITLASELGIPVEVDHQATPMSAPDMIDRVRPATVLLKVTTGPRGVGMLLPHELAYSGYWFESGTTDRGIFQPGFSNDKHFSGELLVDSSGELLDDDSEAMLPLMLGSASAVGIERLPQTVPGRTVSSSLVLIPIPQSRQHESFLDPYDFGNFASRRRPPWMRHQPPSSPTSKALLGTESTTIVLGEELADGIEVVKTYSLSVVSESENQPPLSVTGSGTGKFDPHLGRMLQMDYKMTITVNQDNVTLKIPITMKYRLVDEEALAKERIARQQREQARKEEATRTSKNGTIRSQPTPSQPVSTAAGQNDPPFQSVKAVSESTHLNLFDPDQ